MPLWRESYRCIGAACSTACHCFLTRASLCSPLTCSPLETSVSIVHIPVHLAQHYTNELYWTLERARECEFFNLTANRIEVSQPAEAGNNKSGEAWTTSSV